MMTLQRIFDKVVKHLRKQGKRCMNVDGNCLYRLETRKKVLMCAAGCLIPKRDYNPNFEGFSVQMDGSSLISVYFADKFAKDKDKEQKLRLIKALQVVHDNSGNWEDGSMIRIENKFKETANDFGLTYTAPTV